MLVIWVVTSYGLVGGKFLRNISIYLQFNMTLHPRRPKSTYNYIV
jgi:hypothetical protein